MDAKQIPTAIVAQKVHSLAEQILISIVGTTKGKYGRGHESGYSNPSEMIEQAYTFARLVVDRQVSSMPDIRSPHYDEHHAAMFAMRPKQDDQTEPGVELFVLKLECLRRLVTAVRDIQIRETKKGMKWVSIDAIESSMDVLLQIINDLMSEQVPLDDFIGFIERRLPEFSIPSARGQS